MGSTAVERCETCVLIGRPSRASASAIPSHPPQLLRDLLLAALPRRFVGAKPDQPGPVAEPPTRDVIERHFDDHLGLERSPGRRALVGPATGPTRRVTREPRSSRERLEPLG